MKKYYWFSSQKSVQRKQILNNVCKEDSAIIWSLCSGTNEIEIYFYQQGTNNKLFILEKYSVDNMEEEQFEKDKLIEINHQNKRKIFRIPISDMLQYIKILNIIDTSTQYVYRGQSNEAWGLDASVFRKNYTDRKEYEIYYDIKRYNYKEFQREDFFENVIHMQHYGIPTRLLDWTKNATVALYFACADSNVDGKVFMYLPNTILDFSKDEYCQLSKYFEQDFNESVLTEDVLQYLCMQCRKNEVIFVSPPYENDRIRAQKGLFSIKINVKEDYREKVRRTIWNKAFKTGNSKLDFADIKNLNQEEVSNKIRDLDKKSETDIDSVIKFLKECNFWKIEDVSNEINIESDLIEFIIDKTEKGKIKKQLEKIGIDGLYIYPDLNGFIQYMNEKFN